MKTNIVFLLIVWMISWMAGFNVTKAQGEKGVKTVVIDAGHGGKDPGAIGYTKLREKDVALNVSLKVGNYIKEFFPDVKVIYTRDDDRFIELHERASIANKNDADLFISIHANSATNRSAIGTETWVLGLHKSDANLEVVKRENSVIKMEDGYQNHYEFDPDSEAGHIIMAMKQNVHLDQSISFASEVQSQFTNRVFRKNRGVKQAGFLVLYKTTMPSVLVELGFLSNPQEEKFLRSEEGKVLLASAIYRAFKEYKLAIDEQLETVKNDLKTGDNKVTFRIQVQATSKKLKSKSKLYRDFDLVLEEKAANGIYKYLVGNYHSYASASRVQKNAISKGYPGAFLVAYKEGIRISIDDALTQVGN